MSADSDLVRALVAALGDDDDALDLLAERLAPLSRRLDPADVECIARRVVELQLDGLPVATPLMSATDAATRLGVGRAWVYRHASALGGKRLGDGPRARLRFDPARVTELANARVESKRLHPPAAPRRRRSRRPATGLTAADNPLLPDPARLLYD
jgi:hypothetical protein